MNVPSAYPWLNSQYNDHVYDKHWM